MDVSALIPILATHLAALVAMFVTMLILIGRIIRSIERIRIAVEGIADRFERR